jgi:UDP-2,3-diacylglucosamine pyrophosphatase LpxH
VPDLLRSDRGHPAPGDDGRDLVVLADVHMAAGPEGLREDFRHDEALARLLAHVTERAPQLRLVVLGDLLDFLTAERPASGGVRRPDTSEAGALAKLDRIAAAHRPVFRALGAFVAAGGRLTIVPGNHDMELMRLSAQRRMRQLVTHEPEAATRIDYVPWVLHLPGLLYAEHGSQYHDLHSFATLLAPWAGEDAIELPLGSLLAVHHLAVGAAGGARTRWRAHGALAAVAPLAVMRLRRRAARARYRAGALAAEAQAIGLDRETLASIDRLGEASAPGIARRMLRLLANRARGRGAPAGLSGAPAPGTVDERMVTAAGAIDALLAERGAALPFYALAHTHRPAVRPLRDGDGQPWYLNTGAWATGLRPPTLSCVRIARGAAPTATVEAWDDARGALAPLGDALTAGRRPPGPRDEDRPETALSPR